MTGCIIIVLNRNILIQRSEKNITINNHIDWYVIIYYYKFKLFQDLFTGFEQFAMILTTASIYLHQHDNIFKYSML